MSVAIFFFFTIHISLSFIWSHPITLKVCISPFTSNGTKAEQMFLFFVTFKWKHVGAVVCVCVFVRMVRDYFLSDWLCEEQKQIQMCRFPPLWTQLAWAEIIAAVLISRMKTSSSGFSKWASSSASTTKCSRHATVRRLAFLSRGELVTTTED